MTKEINSLTPRELKKFHEDSEIIKKAFNLSDEELDTFFCLVKNAGPVIEQVRNFQSRLADLERTVHRQTKADDADRAKKLYDAMNTPTEAFRL